MGRRCLLATCRRSMATSAKQKTSGKPTTTTPKSIDYYSLLGVSPEATKTEIREGFFRQARACHPDVRPDDAEAAKKFMQIKEAYTTLSDPESRQTYDRGLYGGGGDLAHESAATRAVIERESREEELAALKQMAEDANVVMKTRQQIRPDRIWTWKMERSTFSMFNKLRTNRMIADRYAGGNQRVKPRFETWLSEKMEMFKDQSEKEGTTRHDAQKVAGIFAVTFGVILMAYVADIGEGSTNPMHGWLPKSSEQYRDHMKALGLERK